MEYRILVINPGSTSTKVAVYQNEHNIFSETISHSAEKLAAFSTIGDQSLFRYQAVAGLPEIQGYERGLHAVVGRGGFMKPLTSGVYRINSQMIEDIKKPLHQHASNLGVLIAVEMAEKLNIPAFVVDPVVVDELQQVARIAGHKDFERKSFFHPLNHKATARKMAVALNTEYERMSCIVAHMGGGITIGAHYRGRAIDVNNGLDGEAPFSPERSGALPVGDVIRMCFSGKYSESEMLKKVTGQGGIVSYLGTNDLRIVEQMAKTNELASLLLDAMAYQVAKAIGAAAVVLDGRVDGIALTGGIAFSKRITDYIEKKVCFIAPVFLYPGESEMEALALGALRALKGEEECMCYPNPPVEGAKENDAIRRERQYGSVF